MRDNWGESDDGKELKKLTKKVAAYKRPWGHMANVDDKRERAQIKDQIDLKTL